MIWAEVGWVLAAVGAALAVAAAELVFFTYSCVTERALKSTTVISSAFPY
jgi:hypothetical protein